MEISTNGRNLLELFKFMILFHSKNKKPQTKMVWGGYFQYSYNGRKCSFSESSSLKNAKE